MKLLLLAALSILTTSVGEVQIPIADIQSISYDKTTGTEMYVNTTTGSQTYQLSDIVRMTLSDVPEPSAIPTISAEDARDAQKVLVNGTVYVIRDGKVFTLEGKPLSPTPFPNKGKGL